MDIDVENLCLCVCIHHLGMTNLHIMKMMNLPHGRGVGVCEFDELV